MALNFLNDGYFAGKVGIGTESPSYNLVVSNGGAGGIEFAINTATGLNEMLVYNRSTSVFEKIRTQALQHEFYTATAEVMRIQSDATVYVKGQNNGYDGTIRIGERAFIEHRDAGSTTTSIISNYNSDAAKINFKLKGVADAAAQMTILGSGNVGIGTAVPDVKLDVRNGELIVRPGASGFGGAGKIGHSSSNAILQLYDSSANEKVRISTSLSSYFNGGNVGIGTTSPGALLHLSKSSGAIIRIQSSITNTAGGLYGGLEWYNTDPTTDGPEVVSNIMSYQNDANGRGGYITLGTTNGFDGVGFPTERMRITSTGGISFGSTGTAYGTSGQILKSNGNASPTWIDGSAIPGVPAGSGTVNTIPLWTPDGDTLGNSLITTSGNDIRIPQYVVHSFDTNTFFGFPTTDTITFSTDASERMRITSTGDVGIGTSSPNQQLELMGNNAYTSKTRFSYGVGATNYFADWGYNSGGNKVYLTITDGGVAKDVIVANYNGNVGIGTASPTEKLDISGTAIVRSTLFTVGNVHGFTSSYGASFFINNGGGTSYFNATGGNVGIGDTTPSEKLDVAGNIKIQSALLSNQENTDVDTGTETVASVAIATYTAAFFDFVIKKTTNVRSGTVYACHDGTTVQFTETSTQDLGDTSDVTLSVDISGGNMRLLATVTSDDWSVKSLIRAI